ncbi:MAG TPA: SusD/RagB family nutrient-binding outer membrane lipoprotein [Cyclobacteriaceae bacterium]|jgi:hypothetical protein|nr:SusD/RagB family nutrient-binding outer membrane lipoprotein [Cyclobacteriaceae bacterium]
MKNRFLKFIGAVVGLLIVSSCDKNFEQMNIDPTKLSGANMNFNYVFTSAELITSGNSDANAYEDWRANLIYGSCITQHLSSTTGYWAGDKYLFNAGYLSSYWDANYNNSIRNIVAVVENIKDDPKQSNFYQIARIFKAFMFQRMTDTYGNIPYSEAGLGYIKGITTPKYDDQQAIYDDLLAELKDAAEKLDANAPNTIGSSDLIYAGDPVKWKKFAYSEMVRLAMRLSKVDATKAEAWVKTAVDGGVFTSNDDNAILKHQDASPNSSGGQIANGTGSVLGLIDPTSARVSETFINYLKNNDDPRLTYIATVVADPTVATDMGDSDPAIQIGQPNGYDLAGGTTDISKAPNYPGDVNKYSVVNRTTFAKTTAATFFLTNSETQLLLAEASFRGWISASSPDVYYRKGVVAAMTQLSQTGASPGISDADANDYVDNNPYNGADALNQINTQYWVATFLDELESWANWRRSDFPVLTPVNYFGNATAGTIPRRYTYPNGEPAKNPVNYSDAVSKLIGKADKMTSRVWWDVE